MEFQKKHAYIVQGEIFVISCCLQGSHKPHCLRKKENIEGYKNYFATLPSHLTPIPLKPNAKFIFKAPSSLVFL